MEDIVAVIGQVMDFVKSFGSLAPQQQAAGAVLLLISLWKTSIVRNFLWDKLGEAKILVAPVLGVVYALVAGGSLMEGLKGGMLAIALHQLLDSLKVMPVIGEKYKWLIELAGKLLGKPADAPK